MKVVLFGASGMIGSRVLDELLSRGHPVIAVVRHPEKVEAAGGVTAVQGDLTSAASVTVTATGADAAISAYSPSLTDPGKLVEATRSLLAGLAEAGVQRLIMVGG